MKNQIRDLKKLIDEYGVAQTAVWLGYRDTAIIHKWLGRKHVPDCRKKRVALMLKSKPWTVKRAG